MKNISKFKVIIITAFLLVSCTSYKKDPSLYSSTSQNNSQTQSQTQYGDLPEWVKGTPREFPEKKYVTAIGSATDLQTAEDKAFNNLAKGISVEISSNTISSDQIETDFDAENENFSRSFSQSEDIKTKVQDRLDGAYIAKRWQGNGEHYVLGVLDKSKAALIVRREINEKNEGITIHINEINEYKPIQSLSHLKKAIEIQKQINRLVAKYRVLTNSNIRAEFTLADLNRQYKSYTKKISFNVNTNQIQHLNPLKAALAKNGLTAKSSTDSYILTVNFAPSKEYRVQKWYAKEQKMNIDIVNENTGTYVSTSRNFRALSTTQELVGERLESKINDFLSKRLVSFIFESIDN